MMPRARATEPLAAQSLIGNTSGRILTLLCSGPRTVAELARTLGVTGNAVRAQLQRLERDDLASPAGARRGIRRPHLEYELTPAGRALFPRAYQPMLQELVPLLAEKLSKKAMRGLLREVIHRLLRQYLAESRSRNPRQRLREAVGKLNGFALGIELTEEPDQTFVRSCSCPLADLTAVHPELCKIIAQVLAELLDTDVRECCERSDFPRCCFTIVPSEF
jgi:predicted ArsR family transcriptional regulator